MYQTALRVTRRCTS